MLRKANAKQAGREEVPPRKLLDGVVREPVTSKSVSLLLVPPLPLRASGIERSRNRKSRKADRSNAGDLVRVEQSHDG
jgi:hypothetical protein